VQPVLSRVVEDSHKAVRSRADYDDAGQSTKVLGLPKGSRFELEFVPARGQCLNLAGETPLVLLWPATSQRKHWYAMLCVVMLWPPLLNGIISGRAGSPAILFTEFRHNPGLFGWLELFALCSSGCYLLSIHWQHRRLRERSLG